MQYLCLHEVLMNIALQPWEKNSDVLYCRSLVKKGEKVTAVTDGMPTWCVLGPPVLR